MVVEVRDTGCGIPAGHRNRLFDPFFTTKPVGMGTGLGLPICHGIVTALGGEIEVESEPGMGSTFRVLLPASAGEPALTPAPRDEAPHAPGAARRGRVLVVDDEERFCRMAERVLGADHDVVALADAREALRCIREGERFDVLLTDLAMPALSGMELHEAVAQLDPTLAERTLFMTGGVFTPLAAEFVARHQGRVLEKPLGPGALKAAVERSLEGAVPPPRAAAGA